jgi:hypothetical protein
MSSFCRAGSSRIGRTTARTDQLGATCELSARNSLAIGEAPIEGVTCTFFRHATPSISMSGTPSSDGVWARQAARTLLDKALRTDPAAT